MPSGNREQPNPCKSASVPCCSAMTSCGSIALGAHASAAAIPIVAQLVPASYLAQPLTRFQAPEPPPPRA
jgi:hypothetical protein